MIPCDKRLFLVFEYLNQDLKKYMDSVEPPGIELSLVKVSSLPFYEIIPIIFALRPIIRGNFYSNFPTVAETSLKAVKHFMVSHHD